MSNIFNCFINMLLEVNLENLEQQIKVFSEFMNYANIDYKYNGAYLEQYIDEFKRVCLSLPNKQKKYKEIVTDILIKGMNFDAVDVLIDNVFHGYCSYLDNEPKECEYIAFDKEKIVSNFIEIKILLKKDSKEYVFYKKYNIENQLLDRVNKDINAFLRTKKLGGLKDVTS